MPRRHTGPCRPLTVSVVSPIDDSTLDRRSGPPKKCRHRFGRARGQGGDGPHGRRPSTVRWSYQLVRAPSVLSKVQVHGWDRALHAANRPVLASGVPIVAQHRRSFSQPARADAMNEQNSLRGTTRAVDEIDGAEIE